MLLEGYVLLVIPHENIQSEVLFFYIMNRSYFPVGLNHLLNLRAYLAPNHRNTYLTKDYHTLFLHHSLHEPM